MIAGLNHSWFCSLNRHAVGVCIRTIAPADQLSIQMSVKCVNQLATGLISSLRHGSRRTWGGCGLIILLAFSPPAGCSHAPSAEPKAIQTPAATTMIAIRTSSGATVAFTPSGPPLVEIVNDRLNLALNSREGMVFELVELPTKNGIVARRYTGREFRALLLHSGFQEEAATGDEFKDTSQLEIIKRGAGEAAGAEFHYVGKIRAGAQVLAVHLRCSCQLPAEQKFLTPNP
jgi:hypothetical protein